jgi:pyruvate-formate lyase-activating enzyme
MTLDFRSLLHLKELPNGPSAHNKLKRDQSEGWGRVIVGLQGCNCRCARMHAPQTSPQVRHPAI